MTYAYYAGFDTIETPMSVVVAGPGSGTATISASSSAHTWGHVEIAQATASDPYYDYFASAVQTALNSVVAGFTVSFSTTTAKYTISHASTFSLTWTGTSGTNLQRALGFTSGKSGSNSYTSDAIPYYAILPSISARTAYTEVYEANDIVQSAVADGGKPYSVAMERELDASLGIPSFLLCDWTQQMEAKEATFIQSASATAPWTWQHFFWHVRGTHPFTVFDDALTPSPARYFLRAEGAAFTRDVVQPLDTDWDAYWSVNLKAYFAGLLP